MWFLPYIFLAASRFLHKLAWGWHCPIFFLDGFWHLQSFKDHASKFSSLKSSSQNSRGTANLPLVWLKAAGSAFLLTWSNGINPLSLRSKSEEGVAEGIHLGAEVWTQNLIASMANPALLAFWVTFLFGTNLNCNDFHILKVLFFFIMVWRGLHCSNFFWQLGMP